MNLRVTHDDTRLSQPECAAIRRTRAAGPVEVTQYAAGKVIRHYVIPAPGDKPQPLPKVGPMNRAAAIAAGKGIDQTLVSTATQAKRRNRTFTEAGEILNEQRQQQEASK